MINVGLLGFGLSGRYLQAPFFMVNDAFNLKAIVTSQEIPSDLFPHVIRFSDLDLLLSDPTIDLISICSPNFTHFDFAKKSLLAGKHVLIEKPMSATSSEAIELYALAKKQNRVCCTYQNRRFDSDFLTIQKLISSNILGEINSFEASYDRFKPELNSKEWKETATPGSGILYDLGAHLIDQAICLFGKPESYYGETFTERSASKIDDAFNLFLNYPNLKVTLKSSLMVKEQGPRYVIHGTKGTFVKYGIDIQEDQLKVGIWPDTPGFGKEQQEFNGVLNTIDKEIKSTNTIDTISGNWMGLFINLAEVIHGKSELKIQTWQIIEQLKIIESIKKLN